MRNRQPGGFYLPGPPVLSCCIGGIISWGVCAGGPFLQHNKCWSLDTSWWPLPPESPTGRGGRGPQQGEAERIRTIGWWINLRAFFPRHRTKFRYGTGGSLLAQDSGFWGVAPCQIRALCLCTCVCIWLSITEWTPHLSCLISFFLFQ